MKRVTARLSEINTRVALLDLDADLLLVCDSREPLGLAGIMGGKRSGITLNTTSVHVEGAFLDTRFALEASPGTRHGARRQGGTAARLVEFFGDRDSHPGSNSISLLKPVP